MKAFMLGWEFPPFISGGLGTACYGLTKAMGRLGMQIAFILPKGRISDYTGPVKILSAEGSVRIQEVNDFENVSFHEVSSHLRPYVGSWRHEAHSQQRDLYRERSTRHIRSWHSESAEQGENYPQDMAEQVHRYATKVMEIATVEDFDLVHAHDWMTYPAGIAVAKSSGEPLIVHVHSTEFDRSGEHVNQSIYDIERQGMHSASKVITVSNYTRNIIIDRYGVASEKVEVVYNGIDHDIGNNDVSAYALPEKTDRIVLFLGRITMQKGPEYFLAAAKKVLEKIDNVKFVMAGDGDMTHRMVEYAAYLGIGHKVLFTRFLQGADVDRAYQMADLYVMPSVSEPFGITPLEALKHNVPVLISKQSGIGEILTHALKVDFWDIYQMANKIVAVLKLPVLRRILQENGHSEVCKFSWQDAATKIKGIYERVITGP